jgi:hypothetical protein
MQEKEVKILLDWECASRIKEEKAVKYSNNGSFAISP